MIVTLRMDMAKTEVTIEMAPPEGAATDMEEGHRLHDMKEEETIGRGLVRMTALGGAGDPPPWTATDTLFITNDYLQDSLFRILCFRLLPAIVHLVQIRLGLMVYES